MSNDHLTYKFLDLHFCYDGREPFHTPDAVSPADMMILRELGKQVAEIASLPVNQKRINNWKNMNSLKQGKIMVGMDEVCWNELSGSPLLQIKSSDPFCQRIEALLRQQLYQWKYMQVDMVMNPVIYSTLAITHSGVGLTKDAKVISTDKQNDVVSHHYAIQIREEGDIEKLTMPLVSHDTKLSEKTYQLNQKIFNGILKVEKRGAPGFWFAPWDDIVMWTGVQEVLLDLIVRPEYVHSLMKRMMQIAMHTLDEYERLDLLATNNANVRVGSGSYGYTSDLPEEKPSKASHIWGNATPQIFSSVGPVEHKEFALDYEMQWLQRFGLTYYGCCEPLHDKMDILKNIPNLRKISVSPWCDLEKVASMSEGKYVLSIKPTPAVLAETEFSADRAKADLERIVKTVRKYNCCAEIVMKDISTVKYDPERLWKWVQMAKEMTENN